MAIAGVNDYTNTYAATKANYGAKGSSGLGETAQSYLNDLKQKYSDVNITVTDFKNEKQMDNYMFGSSGGNNIAISSNIIEKMATDSATAAKYEKVIADVPKSAEIIKEGLAANGAEMVASGTVIDKDGKVSYWCIGKHEVPKDDPGNSYKEQVQKQLEEKRAKKKEEEALEEKRLEKAESVEKLLKKIQDRNRENKSVSLDINRGNSVDYHI